MVNSRNYSPWLVLARLCSGLVFVVLRYGLHYRYQTIYRNLTQSFPGKNPAEIIRLTEQYYRHLSDLCVEPFLFALASTALQNHLARFTNTALLDQLYQDRKPVVVLASHYGNWEYLIQLPSYCPYPVYTAYSPPRQPWVNRLLLGLRRRFGVRLIPQSSFYRQMLTRVRQAGEPAMVVVIADQRPGPSSLKHQLMFLHQHTYVQLGAERLAQQMEAAVMLVDCSKVDRFCYEYRLQPVSWVEKGAAPLALTQSYFRHLEKQIHRSPAYWLWSHDRWKISASTPELRQPVAV